MELASAVMLNSVQHLMGKGFDETSGNLFSINLDRIKRYAMIKSLLACSL